MDPWVRIFMTIWLGVAIIGSVGLACFAPDGTASGGIPVRGSSATPPGCNRVFSTSPVCGEP